MPQVKERSGLVDILQERAQLLDDAGVGADRDVVAAMLLRESEIARLGYSWRAPVAETLAGHIRVGRI